MPDQRIIERSDGWHFKVRGGNTIGPFADLPSAEQALANYCNRWRRRTDTSPGRWRNWRRVASPLAATAVHIDDGGVAALEPMNAPSARASTNNR